MIKTLGKGTKTEVCEEGDLSNVKAAKWCREIYGNDEIERLECKIFKMHEQCYKELKSS